jgi:hypothetical protein
MVYLDDGILWGEFGADAPLTAYLEQLVDEGFASRSSSGISIPWHRLYLLLVDEAHAASIPLLGLPTPSTAVPKVSTKGTPSDSDFAIRLESWFVIGEAPFTARRSGGVLFRGKQATLLPESVWILCELMQGLNATGSSLSRDERLELAGRIRSKALEAGASLDAYLASTEIINSNRVDFSFSRDQVAGVTVVEMTPQLSGAPSGLMPIFDQMSAVQKRYDVPTVTGGIAHVVPGPSAAAALKAVKSYPGRRIAGQRAYEFFRNPAAALGPEAADAIDETAFNSAVAAAGIGTRQMHVEIGDSGEAKIGLSDTSGVHEDSAVSLSEPGDIQQFCKELAAAQRAGQSVFGWRGYDVELPEGAEPIAAALSAHATALRKAREYVPPAPETVIQFAELLDLAAYSDRVVGFDAETICTPYVARLQSGDGWIPENIERGVRVTDKDGAVHNVPLSDDKLGEIAAAIAQAKADGKASIAVPGIDQEVPVEAAEAWLEGYAQHAAERRLPPTPRPQRDPKSDGKRASLKILHNIERIEYQKQNSPLQEVPEDVVPELPAALLPATRLLDHQRFGLAWLQSRLRAVPQGVSGCVLADDMGLGKTLQSLCLIVRRLEETGFGKPCLVVAPVSLLENWKAEIRRFFNYDADMLHTLYGDGLSYWRQAKVGVAPALVDAGIRRLLNPEFEAVKGIVLTTYETLRDYEFSLARVNWGIVVCDEAQRIKTPSAFVTRAAKSLKAEFRIACTGTPVENTLADLWCLFDFIQPGYLGSLNSFTRKFRQSIETNATDRADLVEVLREAIEPWVLRRMKTDVAKNLPPKVDNRDPEADLTAETLRMSGLQHSLYADAVAEFRTEANSTDAKRGSRLLGILHRLRMICSHPLAVSRPDHEFAPVDAHLQASPKLAWLLRKLTDISRKGEKAIVFSEFREVQRLLQRAIHQQFGFRPQIINGSTSVDVGNDESRQGLIDRFQATPGFSVLVLSTSAVGFGVNIQAANHVIHFTRSWNPAKEDQATDRAYRIGQTKPVYVYTPTVCGDGFEAFDQRIRVLLESKRDLSRDMLAGVQEIGVEDFAGL